MMVAGDSQAAISVVFREEAGQLTASLTRILGDFGVAEEIVQDSLLIGLERWPRDGIPDRPGAWLWTVARRLALNRLHRDARYREKLALLRDPASAEPDDRLRLIFTCCHPALAREAQIALTLRAVCGFTTAQIARAFLASEAAVAQRLVRARRKIVQAGIPYRIPADEDFAARLNEVLAVLYLMFNEGHLSTTGTPSTRRDVADDAAWLAAVLSHLLPSEPEPLGLLALMRLHLARAVSRFDSGGDLVLLRDQDRARWDRRMIAEAVAMIERAGALHRVGPYQVEAAIAALHAAAPSYEATDWVQIVSLYELLLSLAPSPVGRLNRAIALRQVAGPAAALEEVEGLVGALQGYHLFHAARGELLSELGRIDEARAANQRALELTANPAERRLLQRRLSTETIRD